MEKKSMNKIVPIVLIILFISGLFVAVFNPVSALELIEDSWNTKTPMNQERAAFGVVTVDSKIYAIGGYTTDYSNILNTNERYDPKTDTWTTVASMLTPRHSFSIVACNGKIYCMGGTIYEAGQWVSCKFNEVYDPITNSWNAKASTPFEGSTTMVQAVNGKIFVMIGENWYMYDPRADSWTQKTNPPYVGVVSSAVVNSKIVVYCNIHYWLSPFEAKTMIYDVETDKLSEMKTQPFVSTLIQDSYRYPPVYTLASSGATTGLFAPQRIYSFFEGKTFVHDPLKDTWSTAKNPPTDMPDNPAIVVVDDVFYAVGSTFIEQYVPIGYRSTAYATPVPSNSGSSEASESNSTFSYIIIAISVLIIGVIIIPLFFISKKTKKKNTIFKDTSTTKLFQRPLTF
jgi:flagellar basal body-associated protein FliL